MNIAILPVTLLTVLAAENPATTFETGDGLLRRCVSENVAENIACTSYIQGVADLWEIIRTLDKSAGCLPIRMTGKELTEVVVKHLKERPELGKDIAASVVITSVGKEFNCK